MLRFVLLVFLSSLYQVVRANDTIFLSQFDKPTYFEELNQIKVSSYEQRIPFESKLTSARFRSFSSMDLKNKKDHLIKFIVTNDFTSSQWLFINGSHNDFLTLYVSRDNILIDTAICGYIAGIKKTFFKSQGTIMGTLVPPQTTVTCYIDWNAALTYHQINQLILVPQTYIFENLNDSHMNGVIHSNFNLIFFGAVFFIFLFVLLLFSFNRHPVYFYYILYLFAVVIFSLPGVKNTVILASALHLNTSFLFLIHEPSLFLFSGFYGFFVLSLLEITHKNHPFIYRFVLINSTIMLSYAVFLVTNILFYDFAGRDFLYIASRIYVQCCSIIFLVLLTKVRSLYKGFVIAGSLVFFISGIIAFVFDDILGINLSYQGFRINYYVVLKTGILVEILFFGMALGRRMFITERDKDRYNKHYIKQMEQKQVLLEKMNTFKAEALRSQFNPHFVFNSLNAINYLILSEDTEQASIYVNKFASLFRKILEASRVDRIDLNSELTLLKLYIEVEQQRLNNSFTYFFDTQKNIHLEEIFLPPMLLQPFVENAIWHGLQKSDRLDKYLKISVEESTHDIFIITIEDNGIGMQTESKIKEHQSLGMKITEERIATFNQSNYANIQVEVQKMPSQETGTSILIIINQSNLL
ncbi:MAG: histidine kinase [Chitinophagales bacterium]|nr:histidine kinase [Chitinophagales bacterium]